MATATTVFDDAEMKIRKSWIAASWAVVGLNLVEKLLLAPLLEGSLSFLFLLAVGYSVYRCAFKKPGTRWLTTLFVLGVAYFSLFLFLMVLYLFFRDHPAIGEALKNLTPLFTPLWLSLLLFDTALSIWWLFLSWKLRNMNQRIQALKKMGQEAILSG